MDAIETVRHAGLTIKIYPDTDPSDPRGNDNMGVMLTAHRRYALGDEQVRDDVTETINGRMKEVTKAGGIVLPLYLMDHSGISMSTGDYGDPWDSGCVGIIYATAEAIRESYMTKRITKAVREKATELLKAEVSEYSDFISGQVYGYVIEDANGEEQGSCWGFIGDTDYALGEAKAEAEAIARRIAEQEAVEFARLPIP